MFPSRFELHFDYSTPFRAVAVLHYMLFLMGENSKFDRIFNFNSMWFCVGTI